MSQLGGDCCSIGLEFLDKEIDASIIGGSLDGCIEFFVKLLDGHVAGDLDSGESGSILEEDLFGLGDGLGDGSGALGVGDSECNVSFGLGVDESLGEGSSNCWICLGICKNGSELLTVLCLLNCSLDSWWYLNLLQGGLDVFHRFHLGESGGNIRLLLGILSLLDDLPFGSLSWTIGTSALGDFEVDSSGFVVPLLGDLIVCVVLQLLHVLVHGGSGIFFKLLKQQSTRVLVLCNGSKFISGWSWWWRWSLGNLYLSVDQCSFGLEFSCTLS